MLWPRLGPPLLALAVRIPHEPTRRKLTLMGELHDTAAAFNRGDLEGAFAGLDPDVRGRPPGFPDSGALKGRRAVHDFYESQIRDWARAELQYDSVGARGCWAIS